jgi:hypothetical protein
VLWGTDCIWTGSPQPQIAGFRTFQIEPAFAQEHGYSQLTPEIKRKIFGLNAARLYGIKDVEAAKCRIGNDEIERLRSAWREMDGDSHEVQWVPRGPIGRRDMLDWVARNGGRWQLG